MPHISPVSQDEASQETKDVYADFARKMLFALPPNFIKTQGHSATVARATWDLVRGVLVSGQIPRWIKEMMFVAISKERNCHYCVAAHLACCRMLGVHPDHLDALVRDIRSSKDLKLRDMILFAVKCATDPQSLTGADYQQLRDHGLKESEIVEVVAMSALAVYANIIADATTMEPDPIFDKV
jgi:uncharacterized peroxidase-related enzyme